MNEQKGVEDYKNSGSTTTSIFTTRAMMSGAWGSLNMVWVSAHMSEFALPVLTSGFRHRDYVVGCHAIS